MADISSINLNGNSYNIKDNNAVSKSGDTMTGTLDIKSTSIDSSVTPSTTKYLTMVRGLDKNDVSNSLIRTSYSANGNETLQLVTHRVVNGVDKYNNFSIGLDASGNPIFYTDNPVAFCNAINAVNKSGDIISGTVTFYQPGNSYTDSILCVGRISKTYIGNLNNSTGYTRTGITQENGNGNKEYFRLPISYSTENNNTYDILTSKNAVTVAQGGTGKTTHTANAVLTGNGTGIVNNVATKSGAFYATAANGAPSFGTLPVAQGGTGVATLTSGAALIGNGTNDITTRSITNNTSKNYITANTNLITANTLGYWNGAYNNSGSSNISYLGTISKGTWQGSAIGLNYGGTGGTDSGWKSVTNSSAFSGTIYYRKIGHFGEIYAYNIKLANPVSDSNQHVLATIDSAYAPDKGFSMNVGSRYIIAQLLVGSDGKISIYKNTSSQNITTDHTFHLNFTYFI